MRPGDRPRFERGLAKLLQAVDGTHSPSKSIIKTYWSALQDLPVADIERAMLGAIKEDDRHVTPANLRSRVQPTTSYEHSKHPSVAASRGERPSASKRSAPTEYDLMYGDAAMSYARRIAGGPIGAHMLPKVRGYSGDFDYLPSVQAAPVPAFAEIEEHRRVWREFREILRHEWAIYSEQKTPPDAA